MLFVVASSLLVGGCGAFVRAQGVQPVQPVTTCTSSSCTVHLSVDEKCNVEEPGTLRMTKKDTKITWDTNNPKVSFAADGVKIQNAPGNVFSDDPGNPHDRKKFKINNRNQKKNGDATNYKYTIRLEGLPNCKPFDPVVMNDCTDCP
jgi:hypothetical protein